MLGETVNRVLLFWSLLPSHTPACPSVLYQTYCRTCRARCSILL